MNLAPQTPVTLPPPKPRETFPYRATRLRDGTTPLELEDFLSDDARRRKAFAHQLVSHLNQRGFFYLRPSPSLLARHGRDIRFERCQSVYREALLAHPYLADLLHAPSVFETGYNATWFPESTRLRQAIEAFMAKPHVWRHFRKQNVPEPVRGLLTVTEDVYRAVHDVGLLLIEALELGHGLHRGSLRRLFKERRDGAVRFVKYHAPCAPHSRRRQVAPASEPHIDKSFFTFNLGESRPGLVWLPEGGSPRLLPNGEGNWLVTSGLFSQGLTRHLERPVVPFTHTVRNDGDRIVILGFVTPEGILHDMPLEQWPHPSPKASRGPSRG